MKHAGAYVRFVLYCNFWTLKYINIQTYENMFNFDYTSMHLERSWSVTSRKQAVLQK